MLDDIFEKSPFETDEEYLERVQELEEELIIEEEYGILFADESEEDFDLEDIDNLDWL